MDPSPTKQAPLLSIVTVCRNESSNIIRTCKSIIEQTWHNFEWIVIDGASTDDTLEHLAPYKEHIAHLVSEPDKGIYDGMNKGIKLATGQYVLFLNGGDHLYKPDVLEQVFGKGDATADILYGSVMLKGRKGNTESATPERIRSPRFFLTRTLPHQACFIRRELFTRFGLYDSDLRIAADWKHFMICALNRCSFKHLDVCVSQFATGGISDCRNDLTRKELAKIYSTYFTPEDVGDLITGTRISWVKVFDVLPFIKVKTREGRTYYYLFGFIPLLSVTNRL